MVVDVLDVDGTGDVKVLAVAVVVIAVEEG